MIKQKVLLIGGAGFIGSHLAEKLKELGHEVIVVDKKRGTKTGFSIGDLVSKELFKQEKPDIIYHLAGAMNLRKGINDPGIKRAKLVCQFCKENKVKKLIFFSSGGAIYFNPQSEYAKANLEIEKIIQESGVKNVILRLSNVYGPGQWKEGIIPQIIKGNPRIKGDGNQTRDFIYIDDVVEAAILAMDKEGIYNISSGQEYKINQVIDLVQKITGLNINPVYQKKDDISAKALNVEKTKQDFNWEPKVSLEQGLVKTIKNNYD